MLVKRWAGHWRTVAVGSMTVLLSACTTQLQTERAKFDDLTTGQVYYLPKAEVQVTVSWELKACRIDFANDAVAAVAWISAQMESIKGEDTAAQRAALIKRLLGDPILSKADVVVSIDSVLGPNWQARLRNGEQSPGAAASLLAPVVGSSKATALVELDVGAVITPYAVADLKHAYAIDYNLMQDGLKGTDYSIETYANGTLKSINITVDDQTGPALQAVATGAARIAAALGGFPLSLSVAQSSAAKGVQPFAQWRLDGLTERPLCRPEIQLRLMQRAALQSQVEANSAAAVAALKGIARLEKTQVELIAARDKAKAALEAMDGADPQQPKAQALVKKLEADLKAATKSVADAKADLADLEKGAEDTAKRLAGVRKGLTVSRSTVVRPAAGEMSFLLNDGIAAATEAWIDKAVKDGCAPTDTSCTDFLAAFAARLAVHAGFHAPAAGAVGDKDRRAVAGIVYRQPVKATMLVCRGAPCVTAEGQLVAEPSAVVLSSPLDLPQLGPLAVLPLKNGPFQNNTIGASFTESGGLAKLTYKSNAAAAEAAKTFESTADTLLKFKDAKRNEERTKLETAASEAEARKKLVEAQLAYEKAQADLAQFREAQAKPGQ
jgi:hypothetical protein